MPSVKVELRNVAGTEAAMGWAGSHTIVVDRPDGRAGGKGLGFNGAELLGLAVGGCFCNDLRYVAATMDVEIASIAVSVAVELSGEPLLATGVTLSVRCDLADGSDPSALIARAKEVCTVANSLNAGVPVQFVAAESGPSRDAGGET